jgi:hypothetical protein
MTLSSWDLQACLHLGKTFCRAKEVLQTDLTKLCMGYLIIPNANTIKRNCNFWISIPGKGSSAWTATPGLSAYSIGAI